MEEEQEELRLKLAEYRGEHQALDALIENALSSGFNRRTKNTIFIFFSSLYSTNY